MFQPLKKIFANFVTPLSTRVENKFNQLFPRAKSIEWVTGNSFDEALFYQDQHEYIAKFDKKGNFIDYKINLDIHTEVSTGIKEVIASYGEMMNVIAIYGDSGIKEYEIIYRNQTLDRYSLALNSDGSHKSSEKL